MSISTFSRQATPQEMAVEIDRRGRVIESLEGEIQRLRVALEFYATHTNYISRIGMESPLTKDNFGDRARSALHQSEKNAGLKAEARVVWEKAHAGHLRQLGACWMDEPPPEDTIAAFGGSVRSAAHAAGKAEGEAETANLRAFFGGMTPPNPVCGFSGQGITSVWGDEKSMEILRKAMHCLAIEPELRTALRHWREEVGKLHSQIDRAKATARAEALEEAKRDLPAPYLHPNGIFEDGWNAAAKEAHEALRALTDRIIGHAKVELLGWKDRDADWLGAATT